MSERRVFIVQNVKRFNFTPALEFGPLKVIFNEDEHRGVHDPKLSVEIAWKVLQDEEFQPDDYLLAVGDPSLIGIVFAIAANLNDGVMNLLQWDKQSLKYIHKYIDTN